MLSLTVITINVGQAVDKQTDPWILLQDQSMGVIKGKVTNIDSFWINTTYSKLIYSKVTIQIEEALKGNYEEESITAIIPGGTVGEHTHQVETNPYGPLDIYLDDMVTVYLNNKVQETPIISALKVHSRSHTPTRSSPTSILEEYGFGFEFDDYVWDSSDLPPQYYVYPNCGDLSGEEYDVDASGDEWGDVTASDFYFQYLGTRSWPYQSDDDINMVYWEDLDAGIGGLCWRYLLSGDIVGFDILLNTDITWTSAKIRDIATHEFGHVLRLENLDISPDGGQTMYTPTHTGADSLEFGDESGLIYLYPNDDAPTITIHEPDPNDSISSSVYVQVSVSCTDDISNVDVCLANAGESLFSRWHSLTESGGYWSDTINLPLWFESGSGYVSVRVETENGIYGFSWVAVTYT